jgi:hypothetical protein
MAPVLPHDTVAAMDDHPPYPPLFRSILCGAHNGPSGVAARRQAAWLAGAEGVVEVDSPRALTGHGSAVLAERCAAHDLLVLPADETTPWLIPGVPVPVLLARWCPAGRDLTDRILVAVGDRPGSSRAARLAAGLAERHRGSVALVAAPGRSRELERALAAAGRVIVRTTGAAPEVHGELARPALAVPGAAARTGASLLVAAIGDDAWDPESARDFARFAACSVLTVPPLVPARRRFSRAANNRTLVPA